MYFDLLVFAQKGLASYLLLVFNNCSSDLKAITQHKIYFSKFEKYILDVHIKKCYVYVSKFYVIWCV